MLSHKEVKIDSLEDLTFLKMWIMLLNVDMKVLQILVKMMGEQVHFTVIKHTNGEIQREQKGSVDLFLLEINQIVVLFGLRRIFLVSLDVLWSVCIKISAQQVHILPLNQNVICEVNVKILDHIV